LGQHWYPISTPYEFGFLPLLFGSFVVTVLAVLISLPFGIMAAIYIGEVAPVRLRLWLKSAVELIVAIPSVVLGFIGLFVLVPLMQRAFGLQTGLCGITGALTLAFMALPTIVSISEDALASVPKDYREASLAMGSTKWETISKVVVPAASSGIVAALMLGIGRAIGETMAVLMVTGNAAELPKLASQWFYSPPDPSDSQYTLPWVGFMSMRTMPATIGAEMGETVQGDAHYHALFACGAVLFVITFLINVIADAALAKARRRGASR
jgi:phosphate transport system permease protein